MKFDTEFCATRSHNSIDGQAYVQENLEDLNNATVVKVAGGDEPDDAKKYRVTVGGCTMTVVCDETGYLVSGYTAARKSVQPLLAIYALEFFAAE